MADDAIPADLEALPERTGIFDEPLVEASTSGAESPSLDPEVMEKLPPEVRRDVRQFMAMSTRVGPMPHPLADKITSDHITKVIEVGEADSKREREDARESRWFALGYVALFCILFVFVTVFLARTNTAVYTEIMKLLAIFLGGVGSGFGAKSFLDRKKGAQ